METNYKTRYHFKKSSEKIASKVVFVIPISRRV